MKKTLLISLSIFVSSLLFLFALTGSKAEKSNDEYLQNIEKIGSDALSEPEFYPKAESVAVDSTEISKLNVVESVAKTLQPEKAMYGFTLKAQSNDDLKGISFVVTKSDDSISDKYVLNVNEDQVDRDGNPTTKGLSEQYLFSAGIKKIDFYYEGERNFEISYYDFESKDQGLDSIKKLTAISTDPNTVYKTRFFQQAGLNIITRADMGLPADSTFAPGWTPPYYSVNRIVIHHTATGVDMINPVNTVKAIWRYHAIDNDWGDFGYNYLIDPYGNIYEGRAGINGVRGNHAPPNEGSIGISILGDYTNQQPTQASTASLIRLMAYLSAVNNIDLTHKTSFDGNNPGGVYGHKDIGQTACPGNTFYPLMDAIANNARLVKQTNTEMNNKIASINSLVEGREYYTGTNRGDPNLIETNILMNIDNLSEELKTKLRNPPSRFAKTTEESDYIMYTLEASQLNQAIRELKLVAPEAIIQPNYKYQKAVWTEDSGNARSVPADYSNTIHWNLQQIKAPEAWYYLFNNTTPANHTGSADVTVAVLDTGVAYETYTLDSPFDVYDRSYRIISDLIGTTFVSGYDPAWEYLCDGWAYGADPCNAAELEKINHGNDDDGHGTFVTSIIASQIDSASPNNILGIAPSVQIMPVKIFLPKIDAMGENKGATYDSIIINGLDHAIANGADVINMSFGGYNEGDPLFEAKIDEAYNAGIVLVGASGNENGAVFFPAALDNVIAVGASNYAGTDKANYSNYGPELDVVAPVGSTNGETGVGAATFSCFADLNGPGEYDDGCGQDDDLTLAFLPNGSYMQGYGTSFAAPQVAAQAALIMSSDLSLTQEEIINRIVYNSTDINTSLRDNNTGYGLVNLFNSITLEPPKMYFRTSTAFRSGQYSWSVPNTKYTVSGDFDGDGNDEIAAMYDYGNNDMSMIVFAGDGTTLSPSSWFRTGPGNWGVANTKFLVAGDFNGDNKDEIAAMYDYGNNDMSMIVFTASGTTFSTASWFRTGPGNWGVPYTKYLVSGDFNTDGTDEIAAMYDYGNNDMSMIVFTPSGTRFSSASWFRTGPGNWGVPYTKHLVSGDFNSDNKDEIAAMYDYGNNDMSMIVFNATGTSFSSTSWFRTGPGNWGVPYTKYLVAGDFNFDGKDEISAMYDYGNNDMSMIVFNATDATFRTSSWFRTGPGNWGVPYTKFLSSGDYDGDGYAEVSSFYDYGLSDMGVILFK